MRGRPGFHADRRSLLGSGLAALLIDRRGFAAHRVAPEDVAVNASRIRWTIAGGRELHGYMAIPARARGRQPAILVIGGADTPEARMWEMTRATAQAGFIACTLDRLRNGDDMLLDDARATLLWLGGSRYATGKLGALGVAGGGALVSRFAEERVIAAGVALDSGTLSYQPEPTMLLLQPAGTGAAGAVWREAARDGSGAGVDLDWPRAWARATAFLREHLT